MQPDESSKHRVQVGLRTSSKGESDRLSLKLDLSILKVPIDEVLEKLRELPFVTDARLVEGRLDPLPTAEIASSEEVCEKADTWIKEQMDKHKFVESESGGLKLGGNKGFFLGGPGQSALTIYNFFRKDPEFARFADDFPHHPSAVLPLKRCMELFSHVPEWRERIDELAVLSPTWEALVSRWEDLETAIADKDMTTVEIILDSCNPGPYR